MSVSLCMIVKNEAANLEACVEPMRELVDEIVVVDTGSSDDTRAIAETLGARVFAFPWCDSFSAARNCALEHATGDWVLILDADDRVVPPEREKLRKLFASLDDRNVGWMFGGVSLAADGVVATEVEQVRLFRRRPDIRWKYRAHEQIAAAIEKSGGAFEQTGIRLVHVGYRDATTVDGKVERNLRLVELDCADMPNDPFPAFYRGVTLSELGRHAEAIVALELCRPRVARDGAMARMFAYALARAESAIGDRYAALETVRGARCLTPGDAVLGCLEAEILVEAGDVAGAGACLLDLAEMDRRDLTTSDLRLRLLFCEILLSLGRYEAAEQAARDLVRRQRFFGLPWLVLSDALLAQSKLGELEALETDLGTIRGTDAALASIRDARDRHAGGAVVPLASCRRPPWTSTKKEWEPPRRGVVMAIG